ncbi:MAG: GFA family protein [Sphingomonas sp.]|nr:GFA family protein [Sphingomonas sp.]
MSVERTDARSGPQVGRCLCGSITVIVDPPVSEFGICHCRSCRRWQSRPWLAIQAPHAKIEGDTLKVFRSSALAERGFCMKCGSHIFHRPVEGPDLAVSIGLFEDSDALTPNMAIFADHTPQWLHLDDKVPHYSGLMMTAIWAPKLFWRALTRRFRRGD